MAHTTGTVTQFANSGGGAVKGLLQKVLDYVLGTIVTGEVIGAGTGIQTVFPVAFASTPVSPGQLFVNYTVGAVVYQAQDDGAGNIVGTHIATGPITYSTGVGTLTFSTPPDNLTNITGDYVAGVAGQDWKLETQRITQDDTGTDVWPSLELQEVILSNSGISGTEKVIIGMREWKEASIAAFGWDLNAYLQYTAAAHWNSNFPQTGRNNYGTKNHYLEHPVFALDDNNMTYWIYSNKQRIIISAKVSGNFETCYLGFGRRFAPPSAYPFPLLAIGSLYGDLAFTDVSNVHRFIAGPWREAATDHYGAWIVTPGNVYKNTKDVHFVPYHDQINTGDVLDQTSDSKAPLIPIYLVNETDGETYMDLDSVKLIASTGVQSEDRISEGGNFWKVFGDIFRNAYYNFLAVLEA